MSPLLRISSDAVAATIDELAKVSDSRREAAAFWLGPTETLTTQTIVIPEGRGVLLQPLSLQISEEWMNLLGEFCDSTGQIVLGAVHCHPEEWSAYSEIDADGFFHAPDFVSVVLPNYGRTELAVADTAWGVYVGRPWGAWRPSRWTREVAVEDGFRFEVRTLRLPE
jgi:proteasome lid subunit RPN8/RPN11